MRPSTRLTPIYIYTCTVIPETSPAPRRSISVSTASTLRVTSVLSFDFSFSFSPDYFTHSEHTHSGESKQVHTFCAGVLEKPPSTRNGRGCLSVGSHTSPYRSPPSGSWKILNVSAYTRCSDSAQYADSSQQRPCVALTWRSSKSHCAGSNPGLNGPADEPAAGMRALAYLPVLLHALVSTVTLW